jgi:excisionase family DNA binding protein
MPINSNEGTNRQTERLAYTIPEAARCLACSPGLLYKLARAGELRLTKLGRRTLVAATPAAADPAGGSK